MLDIFILGAAKPAAGDSPVALKKIGNIARVIDWQLDSFNLLEYNQINFLGGYHIEDIILHYPKINYTLIKDWQTKPVLHSLLQAPFEDTAVLITYADTIFRKHIIKKLAASDADISVAIDLNYQKRYISRSEKDLAIAETISPVNGKFKGCTAEFTGLIHCKPHITKIISSLNFQDIGKSLLDLIAYLQNIGNEVEFVDINGDWAELNEPADIARFVLGNKAQSLSRLAPMVKNSHIGKQISFSVQQWSDNHQFLLNKISQTFPNVSVVIRSSSSSEDNWTESGAGKFSSLLNIDSQSKYDLAEGIKMVIASYGAQLDKQYDQVLIQEFIQNVSCAGVVFTCSLETGGAYYIFNFDDKTGTTDSITSGLNADSRTIILQHSYSEQLNSFEPALVPVLEAVSEISQLLAFDKLDIEFAIDKIGKVHIFQVRPITIDHSDFEGIYHLLSKQLNASIELFESSQVPSPSVFGDKTYFSNMSDWNPAEIIGTHPNPLASSLYSMLITNDIWALQRATFGYRDVRPHPLMLFFCGQPYIDLRASLNSFIPSKIDANLANKIVNAYLSNLKANPQYHDKIEFDIALTVWTPSFKDDANKRLLNHGLTVAEISILELALKSIAFNAISRLESDTLSIKNLKQRRNKLLKGKLNPLNKAYALLDDCKHFGTLAFAHAARHGFIATSFLKSFVDKEILTSLQVDRFMLSINTVASDIQLDQSKVIMGKMGMQDLIKKYGHLRPGTYDATAQAYWEDPHHYLTGGNHQKKHGHFSKLALSNLQKQKISLVLNEIGLNISVDDFFDYLKQSIISREAVKLEFTHNLSLALDFIIEFGIRIGISREQIIYLTYNDLLEFKLGILNQHDLDEIIIASKKQDRLNKMIELPGFITKPEDFYCFEHYIAKANFITNKQITAKTLILTGDNTHNISGHIILIQQADPGYDWLFSHNIAGLITQYGGANSHMAIKTAELGIPAVIGVGEKFYNQLSSSHKLKIDCGNRNIVVIA